MSEEFYTLDHNGQQIEDEEMSKTMFNLMELRPHSSVVYTYDDIGIATLMSDVYDKNIRYCPQKGKWYIWNGCWEEQGEDGIIYDKLETLLNLLLLYCKEIEFNDPEDSFIGDYRKYVKSLRKYTSMRNVIKILATKVRMNLYEMDINPYILNTTTHAYDLKTGNIIENIRDYNVTKKTTCSLPDFTTKPCKRWAKFIDEIMDGDKEKAAFLQRALGYSLLGINREECMFIAYGSKTRNGKGTLFSTIETVLGRSYADSAPNELICEKANGRATDFNAPQPMLAKLVGTRFVTMSESAKDVRLDAASMKTMTGRDTLVTRGLFESAFSFVPQFTLWLNTNHLPAVTDDTVFSSNRIWVIEFNKHFDENEQDKDLKEIFADKENRPTILKWLYDGCMDYIKNGLQVPDSVRAATESYRKMHDRLGCFVEECCNTGDDQRIMRGDLYRIYRQWCMKEENRYKPLGSTTFYNEMSVRGYSCVKSGGDWYVVGLSEKKPGSGSRIPI